MYNLAILLQVIATMVCFTAVLVVAYQKASSYSNIIIITFLCAFVQNGGYILELLSKNATEGMIAIRAEYLGGAFEICLITFFMFKYCGHQFKRLIQGIFILEGVVVILGVWTWEYTHFYYTATDFVADAVIPHMVMKHGWLYYGFAALTVIQLIACIFILTVSILKTNQQHMKTNYIILLFVVIVPLIGFITSITGVLGGYDSTPLSSAIAVGIFAFAIGRKHVFDVADAAGELILSELENAIIILNNENGYEYSNKRANELFPELNKYNRGDIIRANSIRKIFAGEKKGQLKIGDRRFDVNINKVKVKDVEIGTTAILFDTTESLEQIKKMEELMKAADEANKAKSSFLANVSHEIRTPINVVMGMSEILLRDHATDETKEYLTNIRNSSNTLLNLISDILDYSKIESGKLELAKTRFDFRSTLEKIINIYDFRCKQKGIVFVFDIAEDTPRYIIGDEIRINQIIANLLTNAVKFTEKGSVRIKVGFKYRSDYEVDLLVAVEDTGNGMDKEIQAEMYTGFINNTADETRESVSLELNITKQLVELMGGIINYKTEVNKGTVFSALIPVSIAKDSSDTVGKVECSEETGRTFHAAFTVPNAEILIVDDSKINLKVMKELLKDITSNVTLASSGEECLDLVGSKHYDLIFMDHRMPGMDGVETFSRIKQSYNQCQGVPVVMVTANAAKDAKEWYISKGFIDFLPKPVSTEQLATMMYKYLSQDLINMKEEQE